MHGLAQLGEHRLLTWRTVRFLECVQQFPHER